MIINLMENILYKALMIQKINVSKYYTMNLARTSNLIKLDLILIVFNKLKNRLNNKLTINIILIKLKWKVEYKKFIPPWKMIQQKLETSSMIYDFYIRIFIK